MQDNKSVESGELRVELSDADGAAEQGVKVEAVDELEEMRDKYLRAMAELENVRRRSVADVESVARSRAIAVADEFLPLVDAIDAAAGLSADDEGIVTLKKAADSALARVGIVKISAVGEQLNPQFHNAISSEESDKAPGTIIKELQVGYMFGDSVLRTAMVVVAK